MRWKVEFTSVMNQEAEFHISGTLSELSTVVSEETTTDILDTFSRIRRALAEIQGYSLILRLSHCPGGDLRLALALYHLLRQREGRTSVKITGHIGSAATILACAGDTVEMSKGAVYFLHDPSFVARLDGVVQLARTWWAVFRDRYAFVNVYQKRTGLSRRKIKTLMQGKTFLDAAQAQALGFVDQVVDDPLDPEIEDKHRPCLECPVLRDAQAEKGRDG